MSNEFTMYRAAVPTLQWALTNLDGILAKAEAWAEAKKIDTTTVAGLRLVADMFTLARQVQICTDQAKGGAARLAGVEPPKFEDKETTLADLRARIGATKAFLASLKPEQFAGAENRPIHLKFGPREVNFDNGCTYLLEFVQPNVYFHMTTAYAILRKNGLEVGKKDFLGG